MRQIVFLHNSAIYNIASPCSPTAMQNVGCVKYSNLQYQYGPWLNSQTPIQYAKMQHCQRLHRVVLTMCTTTIVLSDRRIAHTQTRDYLNFKTRHVLR